VHRLLELLEGGLAEFGGQSSLDVVDDLVR
jgi:hypothetical protein